MTHAMPRGRIVGEFILIVLGVLAAMMVDTWIEARNDDKLREEYESRLLGDLKADQDALKHRVDFFRAVRIFGTDTLDRIRSGEPVGQDALLAAYYASEIFEFTPIRNTYVDMQNTGNIRLLNDIDLRLALASYHNKSSMWTATSIQDYREIVRGVIPWHIQKAIRKHCPTTDPSDSIPTGFPECTIPHVGSAEATRIFAALAAHPDIEEILTYRVSEVDVAVFLYNVQKGAVQEVIDFLEPE
jgi:hypothetical protein